MSGMGEQGEHFGQFQILSPHMLVKDPESVPVLTLLTLASTDHCRRAVASHDR
jgi:hypothetical protein